MASFAWDESYTVRVRQFDEQHQKLFEIMDNLANAIRTGEGDDLIRDVVGQLAVYTRTHFLQEEVLMKQTGYPALPAHQQQHAQFMASVEKHKSALNAGEKPDAMAVLDFLRSWLVEHIRKSDKAYSSHMNGRGIR